MNELFQRCAVGSRDVRDLMSELGINCYEIRAPLDMHIKLHFWEIMLT